MNRLLYVLMGIIIFLIIFLIGVLYKNTNIINNITKKSFNTNDGIQVGFKNNRCYFDVMYYKSENCIGIASEDNNQKRVLISLDSLNSFKKYILINFNYYKNLNRTIDSLDINTFKKEIGKFISNGILCENKYSQHDTIKFNISKNYLSKNLSINTITKFSINFDTFEIVSFYNINYNIQLNNSDNIIKNINTYKYVTDVLNVLDTNYIKHSNNKIIFDYQKIEQLNNQKNENYRN